MSGKMLRVSRIMTKISAAICKYDRLVKTRARQSDIQSAALDMSFMGVQLVDEFGVLVDVMDAGFGLSPAQAEEDSDTGLSWLSCDLINTIVVSDHSLPGSLAAVLLDVPCRYLGMYILPLENRRDQAGRILSEAIKWVSACIEEEYVQALVCSLAFMGTALILTIGPGPDLVCWMNRLRPRCLIEQMFSMMCWRPRFVLPLQSNEAKTYLRAVLMVGTTFMETQTQSWLLNPSLVYLYKRCLSISRDASIPQSFTDDLIMLVFHTSSLPRPPAVLSTTRHVEMTDGVHLRHLADLACTGVVDTFDMSVAVAYAIVKRWPLVAPLDRERRSGVVNMLRLLFRHALACQRRQLAEPRRAWQAPVPAGAGTGTGPGTSMGQMQGWVQVISTCLGLTNILMVCYRTLHGGVGVNPTVHRLKLGLSKNYGSFAAVETLFRGLNNRGAEVSLAMVTQGLCILRSFPHDHPACLPTCISFAASLRKLAHKIRSDLSICLSLIAGMQEQKIVRKKAADKADWLRLMAIVASIMTGALAGVAWPTGADMDVRRLQPGHCVTAAIMELVAHISEDGKNELPDRRTQGIVWDRFSAAECRPWMLPGCGNWLCQNTVGCSEAALSTRLCSGCRRVRYCSVGCQRTAWKAGGHEVLCVRSRVVVV